MALCVRTVERKKIKKMNGGNADEIGDPNHTSIPYLEFGMEFLGAQLLQRKMFSERCT